MLKEFVNKLNSIFIDKVSNRMETHSKIAKVIQKIVESLQQELESNSYSKASKNSYPHKHQSSKIKLLYSIKLRVIVPLLAIVNCLVSYKLCLNISLTLCSQV